jgi:hypothetical protein
MHVLSREALEIPHVKPTVRRPKATTTVRAAIVVSPSSPRRNNRRPTNRCGRSRSRDSDAGEGRHGCGAGYAGVVPKRSSSERAVLRSLVSKPSLNRP